MIAAFLLPFPLRGHRAPFLWVYYRLLTGFTERFMLIASSDYRRSPSEWAMIGRWEMQEDSCKRLGYGVPREEQIAEQAYRDFDETLFNKLLLQSGGNPVAAFRRLLSERIPDLEDAIDNILGDCNNLNIEAVLSWCNCPSLSAVAGRRGIPVVYLEIGPLRWPDYRPTAYLDFSGVNGNTEAATRYKKTDWIPPVVTAAKLHAFFTLTEYDHDLDKPDFDVGVALQVEDDSNLVAFGNGFDNQSLLIYARLGNPNGRVLVRSHPGSLFALRPNGYVIDDSPGSMSFIRRCRSILTINSSLGLEALLMGRVVNTLGDCSFGFIKQATDNVDFHRRLAFYLFAYLVPLDLVYSSEYVRFRLRMPSETAIVSRHLAVYDLEYRPDNIDEFVTAAFRKHTSKQLLLNV